jgi:hypothetical protein
MELQPHGSVRLSLHALQCGPFIASNIAVHATHSLSGIMPTESPVHAEHDGQSDPQVRAFGGSGQEK